MATLMMNHSAAEEQVMQQDSTIYNEYLNGIREREFPMLHGDAHHA